MIFFDVEATGTDPLQDRIVELALLEATPNADCGFTRQGTRVRRYNPGVPIPEDVISVHGIGPEDVADQPNFEKDARPVQNIVQDEVLCAFNGRSFDTLILDAELRRAGEQGLDLDEVVEIDPYRIWRSIEPRSLEGAVRRYLSREHKDAHSAAADAEILPDIMSAMYREHGLTFEKAVDLSNPDHEVDRAGKFKLRPDGEVVFNFGSHYEEPVADHLDYLDWMLRADFPRETKEIIRRLRTAGYRWPPDHCD